MIPFLFINIKSLNFAVSRPTEVLAPSLPPVSVSIRFNTRSTRIKDTNKERVDHRGEFQLIPKYTGRGEMFKFHGYEFGYDTFRRIIIVENAIRTTVQRESYLRKRSGRLCRNCPAHLKMR